MTTASSSSPTPPLATSSSAVATTQQPTSSSISLVFAQGTTTCVLRPNTVVRGHVDLRLISPCYASGIRVRLRAEETAIALGQEANGESLRNKFQHTTITLFDADVIVSGVGQHENELANWREIAPGNYTFPFALKVPNVNFPPVIPSLDGYSIRYVWTAKVEGPFEPNLSSDPILCQFMPNVLAPKPMEWTFRDFVGAPNSKASSTQLHKQSNGISVAIKMQQQIYVPGDPLSMEATLVNNGTNKVSNIDIAIRRTIRGKLPVAYGELTSQVQQEMMSETFECKVKPGETGRVDILTTVPRMNNVMLPTFETNFVKVFYELLCIIKVKRSVFSGGDTSYTCVIPIPIATHNIDNPTISGHTPRWTNSRLQPYFFDPLWPDPTGDLPGQGLGNLLAEHEAPAAMPPVASPVATSAALVTSPKSAFSPTLVASQLAASTPSAMSPNLSSTNAMHEFLSGGSAELYRERTLKKKTLGRSKSMKDIRPASRITEWRAEREREKERERDQQPPNSTSLNRAATDGLNGSKTNQRSPPIGPRSKVSAEDKSSLTADGAVAYTPPPPTAMRPQKSAQREQASGLTAEQQVELARKASRRILPNQGLYNNDGELPAEYAHYPTATHMKAGDPGHSRSTSDSAGSENSVGQSSGSAGPSATLEPNNHIKTPPKRNASLSHHAHARQQASFEQGRSQPYADDSGKNSSLAYDVHYVSSLNNGSNSAMQRSNSSDQKDTLPRTTSPSPSPFPAPPTERVPYQHNLPAHQQPPGVVPSYGNGAASSTINGHASRREASTDSTQQVGSSSSKPFAAPGASSSSTALITANTSSLGSSGSTFAGTIAGGASFAYTSRIPPWERVEKVQHQTWFRPGPHQQGANQIFDIPSLAVSQLQVSPLVKKTLQVPPESM
ncbi:hypothetical protein BGW42_008036 [Actinomortierella wolfii]|nr:hypothetical protein BGW42_008036 [Actinomortierella wolfii]